MADKDRSSQPYIGRAVPRLEDEPLLTGRATFVADLAFPDQCHMMVVRAPIAHGALRSVDTRAAATMPGVKAVWTSADISEIPPIPFRATRVLGLEPYRQPVLARDMVRYVGEPVAVVFATSAWAAEDAAEQVILNIEERPPLLEASAPLQEFAPGHDTEPAIVRKEYGEVDTAIAAADHRLTLELAIGRHTAVPLETRGALARTDPGSGHLHMHGVAKRPHWNRDQLAAMLGRDPSTIDLHENHVGGGFGVRGELYPEDVLVCLGALRLGRPVKWVESRREHMLTANHSREQQHQITIAFDGDGHIQAIDDTFFHDQGAYIRTHGVRVADMSAGLMLGPYRVPHFRAAGHVRLTNKTPAATYRAPGRFETSFVRERMLDAIGAHLGLGPVTVRRRNLITAEEMPYERPLDALEVPVILDSGDYEGLLDKALATADWDRLRHDAATRRQQGELAGVGHALFVEKTGLGPVDTVEIELVRDGTVEIITGAASVGQGMETVIAQIAADTLGIGYDRFRVVHGQTDRIAQGYGAHASRVTVMTGEATRQAAMELRSEILSAAAPLLQTTPDRLALADGTIRRDGSETGMTLADLDMQLNAEATFRCDHMNYPYGVHIAAICIDAETGSITIEKYLVAYDVGRAVNPMLIEGQLAGGLVQGIGGALHEAFRYSPNGEPLAATLLDYHLPIATEVPPIDVLITEDAPSPLNPLGLKGAGEGGINAAGAALASAIDDALQRQGAVTRLPVTPMLVREMVAQYSQKS